MLLHDLAPSLLYCFFFFQAEDGIRDLTVTGVQTCALPISSPRSVPVASRDRPPTIRRSLHHVPARFGGISNAAVSVIRLPGAEGPANIRAPPRCSTSWFDDDHWTQPASHLAGRRRDRSAFVLPEPRRIPGCRG